LWRCAFGTDGWRGRIGDDYTYTNLRRATQGFADYLKTTGRQGPVVVGHDRRFSADHFAAAACEVLAGNGFQVLLTPGPTPTPVISYSVQVNHAIAALNITASHNPPEDCGFKVRDEQGGAIAPDGLQQIEARIPPAGDEAAIKRVALATALASGQVAYFDPKPAYLAHLAD
jgi:phosphomannomutase